MLINGILTNSEVLYGITKNEISDLEKVDEYLIRQILQAHSKTPIEMLYLETGVVPIKYIIINRRLSYLKHILNTNEHELIRKVYEAQKRRPVENDWILMVQTDKTEINFKYNDEQISAMSNSQYKKIIKEKVRKAAFESLLERKETHSKVQAIKYDKFYIQEYLSSSKFTMREKQLLFKLRTRMLDTKNNFKSMYPGNLQCDYCGFAEQTQRHLLEQCEKIISNSKLISDNILVEHDFIFGSVSQQLDAIKLFSEIEEVREKLNLIP